jgi:hypothetical protein
MSERDVMTLLAAANPVRVEDLAAMNSPNLSARRVSGRLVLAAAVVAAAVAASLIGAFAFSGATSRLPTGVQGEIGMNAGLPGVSVEHPLGPAAKEVSLAAATAAYGPRLVLPDTSLIGPSDVGAVWMFEQSRPLDVTVAVTFPKQGMFIQYIRPYPDTGSHFDVRAHYATIAREDAYFHLLDLGGVPALAADQNSDDTGQNFGVVAFPVGGTEIRVFGHFDKASLVTVARSVLDRSGS